MRLHLLRQYLLLGAAFASILPVVTGQTLADAARKAREQKQQKAAARTYTDEDLAPSVDKVTARKKEEETKAALKVPEPASDPATPAEDTKKKPAEQWTQEILAQKRAVKSLQEQTDKLQASVHYVEANRYSNGPQYNEHQRKKQEAVDQMKSQLAEATQKLQTMQEAARREGHRSNVYNPEL